MVLDILDAIEKIYRYTSMFFAQIFVLEIEFHQEYVSGISDHPGVQTTSFKIYC